MEKLKHNKYINQLVATKEAIYTWYQNRSGSDGRILSGYDTTNNSRATNPSSHKLEGLRKAKVAYQGLESPSSLLSLKTLKQDGYRSNLFDEYEIERISRQLNYYVKLSNVEHKVAPHGGDSLPKMEKSEMKNKKIRNKGKGIFMLSSHGVAYCGSRVVHDVVERRQISMLGKYGLSLDKFRPN